MRHVWLIRHAKSSWNDSNQRDFDRPLNARGERDGPRMAEWLADQPDHPQWLWSSPAQRAKQTAQYVLSALQLSTDRWIEQSDLYLAGVPTIIDTLRGTPSDITSVALVAHNPGLTECVNVLAGESVLDNLPTFGVAHFAFAGEWNDLGHVNGKCVELMSPKQLPD